MLHPHGHQKLPHVALYMLGRVHEQTQDSRRKFAAADAPRVCQCLLVYTSKFGKSTINLIVKP